MVRSYRTRTSLARLKPRILTPRVTPDDCGILLQDRLSLNDTQKTWIVRLYESLQCRN